MLLGTGSLVMALIEPQRSGVQTGFVASTIGVTAIVIGSRLVKDRSRYGSVARAFGRGAAILGAVGTALMAYAVLAFGLSAAGVQLPPLSLPLAHQGGEIGTQLPAAMNQSASGASPTSVPSPVPAGASPAGAAPAPAAAGAAAAGVPAGPAQAEDVAPAQTWSDAQPTSFDEERSAVTMSAGTLASGLQRQFVHGPYPATLAVASAPARVTLPDGTGLAPLPDGARVLYSTSSDRSEWSVTIVGARFGATATYSSSIGTVQAG